MDLFHKRSSIVRVWYFLYRVKRMKLNSFIQCVTLTDATTLRNSLSEEISNLNWFPFVAGFLSFLFTHIWAHLTRYWWSIENKGTKKDGKNIRQLGLLLVNTSMAIKSMSEENFNQRQDTGNHQNRNGTEHNSGWIGSLDGSSVVTLWNTGKVEGSSRTLKHVVMSS